uniref:Dolichol-phosphate mannosyltransferase subunit 1 n=1 Tax=Polytomella parva TaxID=51329 RepID=A0A7S0YDE9_9CHLO|mmetsp:Transcript_193/g.213  ORF Transcript_193/g.213 Transcript_193/m.213 type:complete len:383 (+) Transcript_193:190-1338(+)|eukprot:CAMPEP_0175057734 /NCGR_PEP_ID=MMETSP0052_2-20121109/11432_1 /TAXON_ID=51329 ORGANISM="Polytomella parva, Strain SAG 63-3" /NCGR_SAMPLE_ID=MMETSP0052_2 /ASSEMBLY_ACC=CAM_ASM_000194 /LENGTH=382 /DNA_ID=CAMNT_0016322987 /DNA_START=128 /DNA_END=1276 /DNA_ORIENTATION=+
MLSTVNPSLETSVIASHTSSQHNPELISIISPTYNEVENVPILFQLILRAFTSDANPILLTLDASSTEDEKSNISTSKLEKEVFDEFERNRKHSCLIKDINISCELSSIPRPHLTSLSLRRYTFELIIVDDNSPDGTQNAVEELQRVYGTDLVVLVRRAAKMGLGSAYLHGAQVAKGDWIVLMDADLSHHPRYILDFLAAQHGLVKNAGFGGKITENACDKDENGEGKAEQTARDSTRSKCNYHPVYSSISYKTSPSLYDIVSGTRYVHGGGVSGWDWRRKLTSRGANLLARFILGTRASDLTGSFRLYRRTVLLDLLTQTKSKGYAFQMEVMARAEARGFKVTEVPIVFVDRLFGQSKLGAKEFVMFLSGLLGLIWGGGGK